MNLGLDQIRDALLFSFLEKSALLCLCRMLPSISKITSGRNRLHNLLNADNRERPVKDEHYKHVSSLQ